MAVYYPEKILTINGTQVKVSSNIDVNLIYESVKGTTYNIVGYQMYSETSRNFVYPLSFNILDADGSYQTEITDHVKSPNQKQNVLIGNMNAVVDINNFFSTIIAGLSKIQFQLYHKGSIDLSSPLSKPLSGSFNEPLNEQI